MSLRRRKNRISLIPFRTCCGIEHPKQYRSFQDPGINLRGAKPLIVIDGVPDRTADLWRVNADDIDNISVLKGPTASALYGSVGKDGAIMITTKKVRKES